MGALDLDLAIVGGGPAGLSAAITACSEGLKVCLLEALPGLGGQARESTAIENYPGFELITGSELMAHLIGHANKFAAPMQPLARAQRLNVDGLWRTLITDDGETWAAHSVLLAMGVSYRRFEVPGLAQYLGRGVAYGLPAGTKAPRSRCTIIIIGGANSAGQAALHMASHSHVNVKIVVRRTLVDGMSTYLIERLLKLPNFEALEGAEVIRVNGDNYLEAAVVRFKDGTTREIPCAGCHIFIGAEPKTAWLAGAVRLNERRFIPTDGYATDVPGIFAAGDVRLGSVKRVAAAVGEGAAAVSAIHQYLDAI